MIQKNDFIEISYTGKMKEDDIIFDTTDEKIAKDNELGQNALGPIVICVGQGQILGGIDKNLVGKEAEKEYDIVLQPEEAFGKKSAKLIQLMPAKKFRDNNIVPQPGLQVNIDDEIGIIKTASGGRILVDFNHPLSGKVVEYNVKIIRKVEDDKEKILGYFKTTLGLKDIKADVKEGKAAIEFKNEFPKEVQEELRKKLKEIIPSIKEIEFRKTEEKKEDNAKKEATQK
ncbi:MAG: peptidylprolyl isomerase [Nanoarchaeota archaeon]|nr:peptidylprolyl isomerase [Nanoarchaeota archaeon]